MDQGYQGESDHEASLTDRCEFSSRRRKGGHEEGATKNDAEFQEPLEMSPSEGRP